MTVPSLKPCGILLYNQYSVINFNPIRQKQSNYVSLTHGQCWDDLEKQRIKRAVVRDNDCHHTWSRKIKKRVNVWAWKPDEETTKGSLKDLPSPHPVVSSPRSECLWAGPSCRSTAAVWRWWRASRTPRTARRARTHTARVGRRCPPAWFLRWGAKSVQTASC